MAPVPAQTWFAGLPNYYRYGCHGIGGVFNGYAHQFSLAATVVIQRFGVQPLVVLSVAGKSGFHPQPDLV